MNLRYPGQVADATGFYHNGFRDYSASNGRYLQADPSSGSGLNPYNYVDNNPMGWMDPWGLLKLSDPTPSVIPGYSAPCPENESEFTALGGGIRNDVAKLHYEYTTTGSDGSVYQWNRAFHWPDETGYHGGCHVYKQVHANGQWGSECEYENEMLNLVGPFAKVASRTPEFRVLMPAFQKLGTTIYALTGLRRDEFFDTRIAKTFEAFSQKFAKPLHLDTARLLAGHQAAVASLRSQ